MFKVLTAVFLIFGTVVGSGFSSGKEIFVFFSRFGNLSYFFIILATFCFYFLFRFFLIRGSSLVKKLEKSKVFCVVVGFAICIFCSSMFAGLENLFSYFSAFVHMILVVLLVFICLFVAKRGLKSLEKINLFLMPITATLFLVVLCSLAFNSTGTSFQNNFFGIFYAPLYVVLNTSMSIFVLSKIGSTLSKKQANFACLFSSLLIFVFLTLGNFVLLKVGSAGSEEMPFLSLVEGSSVMFCLMFFVVLSGCFTTLISLCYTFCTLLSRVIKEGFACTVVSVMLPLAISLLGFSEIVTLLYPLCSLLSILALLIALFERR